MEHTAGKTDKVVSAYLLSQMQAKHISQAEIADKIGRTQPYVSDRLNAKKSWGVDTLDIIAPMFGYPSALMLILAASGYAQ